MIHLRNAIRKYAICRAEIGPGEGTTDWLAVTCPACLERIEADRTRPILRSEREAV